MRKFDLNSLQTHSALLLSSIDFLLDRIGWKLDDLNLVAVGIGPGSFTGIRIGIATALGFAQSLSIPFAGISGLDALAHQCSISERHHRQSWMRIGPRSICGEYVSKNGRIRQAKKSALLNISDLERHLADRHLYMVGDLKACRLEDIETQRRRVAELPFLWICFWLQASVDWLFQRKRKWRSGEFDCG